MTASNFRFDWGTLHQQATLAAVRPSSETSVFSTEEEEV